jgi:hypothetical protein
MENVGEGGEHRRCPGEHTADKRNANASKPVQLTRPPVDKFKLHQTSMKKAVPEWSGLKSRVNAPR